MFSSTTWAANLSEIAYRVDLSLRDTNCSYSFVSFIDNNPLWNNPDIPPPSQNVPGGSQRPPNNKVDIAPPACVHAINPDYTIDSPVNPAYHPVFFWQGDNSSAYGIFCSGTYEEHRVTAVLDQVTDQSHQAGIANVTDNGFVRSLGWVPNG